MPKEDYLLKYLEKLSRVIAAMLGLRDKGFPEDALRLADETYKELLTIHLDDISTIPANEFIEIIKGKTIRRHTLRRSPSLQKKLRLVLSKKTISKIHGHLTKKHYFCTTY